MLGCPGHTQQLKDVWEVAVQALKAHANPKDVPLRATSGLLTTAAHIIRSSSDFGSSCAERLAHVHNSQRGRRDPKQQQRLQVILQQHQQQHQLLLQQVRGRLDVVTRVARERLLHSRRRATVLQARNFSAALHTVAREGVPVRDGGLVQALVALSVSAPAVMNAKQRGIGGASRLVHHLEDLAALGQHGVVFCGSSNRSRGRAVQRGEAEAAIDASLLLSMMALREGVESAVGRDGARTGGTVYGSAHALSDTNADSARDSAASSGELSQDSSIEITGVGDSPCTFPDSSDTNSVSQCDAEDSYLHPGDLNSQGEPTDAEVVPSFGSDTEEDGLEDDTGVPEEGGEGGQESTDELEGVILEEKAEETLQALVDGMEWRQGAWSHEMAARLTTALDVLSGGDVGEG